MSAHGEHARRVARAGDWVEIASTLLEAGARAPQVPADTQRVPLAMRARGFALHDGEVGEPMTVTTLAGRTLGGTLLEVEPAYLHGFGAPVPELVGIGRELRALLEGGGASDD